jgi:hypothetical protein
MDVSPITGFSPSSLEASLKPSDNYNAQSLVQLTASQQQKSSLTIVTAEGDRVTISAGLSEQLSALTYNSRGFMNGTELSLAAQSLSYSQSSQFSFAVQGDLNAEEIRDIQKAIKIAGRVIRDFVKGDAREALKDAAKFSKLDSLASVQEEFESSSSVSVSAVTSVQGTQATPAQSLPGSDELRDLVSSLGSMFQKLLLPSAKLLGPLNDLFAEEHRQAGNGDHGQERRHMLTKIQHGLTRKLLNNEEA